MGAQLNLFIHGNPSGLDYWYNRKELGELSPEEAGYIRSFYTSNKSDSAPRFVVETKTEGSGEIISYYHYLVLGGVYEASGRPSGYIGLTLRIGKAFAPDLFQIYWLLRRLFEEKAVGTLVERKGDQGYQFCVGKLIDLEDVFLQWEDDFAKKCQYVLRTTQLLRVASTKTPGESSFALADLLEGSMQGGFQEQLAQGCRLTFSSVTSSRRELSTSKKLQEENRKLQEDVNRMTSENANLLSEMEKLKREKEELDISLKKKTTELEDRRRILEDISHLLGKQRTQSSPVLNPGKGHQARTTLDDSVPQQGHTNGSDSGDAILPRFSVAILLGLLALLLLCQVYLIFQLRSLPTVASSECIQYKGQVDSMQGCDSVQKKSVKMKASQEVTPDKSSRPKTSRGDELNMEPGKKK